MGFGNCMICNARHLAFDHPGGVQTDRKEEIRPQMNANERKLSNDQIPPR